MHFLEFVKFFHKHNTIILVEYTEISKTGADIKRGLHLWNPLTSFACKKKFFSSWAV